MSFLFFASKASLLGGPRPASDPETTEVSQRGFVFCRNRIGGLTIGATVYTFAAAGPHTLYVVRWQGETYVLVDRLEQDAGIFVKVQTEDRKITIHKGNMVVKALTDLPVIRNRYEQVTFSEFYGTGTGKNCISTPDLL